MAAFAFPAHGQACGTRDAVLKLLSERYGEGPVALGLSINGGIVEVFTSANGATWTITISFPDGRMCVVLIGENWYRIIKPEGTAA